MIRGLQLAPTDSEGAYDEEEHIAHARCSVEQRYAGIVVADETFVIADRHQQPVDRFAGRHDVRWSQLDLFETHASQ